MDELIRDFLIESNEYLEKLEQDLIQLEQNPDDSDVINCIFRAIHTIKGSCGFAGFPILERLAHSVENVLVTVREKIIKMDSNIISLLLKSSDAISSILESIEKTSTEGAMEYSELVETLDKIYEEITSGQYIPSNHHSQNHSPTTESTAREKSIQPQSYPHPNENNNDKHNNHIEKSTHQPAITSSTLRIDVSLIDHLMSLVGELVLSRNQIMQNLSEIKITKALQTSSQHLNSITSELQEAIMKTRMQPIGKIFDKFPRTIRDLSNDLGKKTVLKLDGSETELDKSIIESIKDPLTHLIRNAIDHGIESPKDRLKIGKNEAGQVFLRAYHEGGQVNIDIIDDGKGICPTSIKKKAIEKGIISPEAADTFEESDILSLIFYPGFSTAEKVTNFSGRGVGMDVVKENIEKIGGTVGIESRFGSGTSFKIKIPLTLAIIPALTVGSAGGTYAIPQVNLMELVRLNGDKIAESFEFIHGTPVYRLRGNLLPLVFLERILNDGRGKDLEPDMRQYIKNLTINSSKGSHQSKINIVVLHAEGEPFGLVVEKVSDTEEIVVKPLSRNLKDVSIYSGATVMGDGKIALILDILGLARNFNIKAKNNQSLIHTKNHDEKLENITIEQVLIVQSLGDGRIGIPLSKVSRLEKIRRSHVEHTGDIKVVQYRDGVMPIFPITDILRERRKKEKLRKRDLFAKTLDNNDEDFDLMEVVVMAHNQNSIGIIVEQIIDVIEQDISGLNNATRAGVIGSLVIKGRVTEILDVERAIASKFDFTDAI